MKYTRSVRKVLTKEDLLRDEFIREIMVGDCPRCGSPNTHDCSEEEFVPNSLIRPTSIIRIGSDCEVAKKLDDPTVGHCDDCNYLWCLECGSELSIDEPTCRHWEICETCGKTDEFPDACPYEADVSDCPKIRRRKRRNHQSKL